MQNYTFNFCSALWCWDIGYAVTSPSGHLSLLVWSWFHEFSDMTQLTRNVSRVVSVFLLECLCIPPLFSNQFYYVVALCSFRKTSNIFSWSCTLYPQKDRLELGQIFFSFSCVCVRACVCAWSCFPAHAGKASAVISPGPPTGIKKLSLYTRQWNFSEGLTNLFCYLERHPVASGQVHTVLEFLMEYFCSADVSHVALCSWSGWKLAAVRGSVTMQRCLLKGQ